MIQRRTKAEGRQKKPDRACAGSGEIHPYRRLEETGATLATVLWDVCFSFVMPDIGFVYDCEEESIQIGHPMKRRFLLSSFRSPKKNKPVMLAHDGFTSPHALPAIDFLLLRSAFCIRKPRKSSCDAAYQKDIIQTQVNQGLNDNLGKFQAARRIQNVCRKRNLQGSSES